MYNSYYYYFNEIWYIPLLQLIELVDPIHHQSRPATNSTEEPKMGAIWTLIELILIFVSIAGIGLASAIVFETFRRRFNRAYVLILMFLIMKR